ncbi:MAG: ANTAR domain-containing response regulator [Bacillota bacterium]
MRVLLVEDDVITRMDLEQMLREMGAEEVGQCGRGDRAVEMALREKWDLVLMDASLPVMDGLEAADRIRRKMLAPVVLITAYGDAETVERAEKSGVLAYLVKPVDPRRLQVSMELAMARFAELKKIYSDLVSLKEKKTGLETVEKAKLMLQSDLGMSEEQAYSFLRGQSMKTQKKISQVAEDLLSGRIKPKD